jgi:hypothetical protein
LNTLLSLVELVVVENTAVVAVLVVIDRQLSDSLLEAEQAPNLFLL